MTSLVEKPKTGTVKPVDRLLPQSSGNPAIDPLVLIPLVFQEVLQQVEHFGHLVVNNNKKRTVKKHINTHIK